MLNFIKNFANDESGAVTVDWVVLTAAIVGIGIAVMGAVSGSVKTLGASIASEVAGQSIDTTLP